ncbi:MAG: 23S rRNA (pseudouridine(1915)-N(3))-methyltransferase RlmH, partial [Paracoccaceae bacterium]
MAKSQPNKSQARAIALDERGKNESSAVFAARIGRWRDDGIRAVTFLIGG